MMMRFSQNALDMLRKIMRDDPTPAGVEARRKLNTVIKEGDVRAVGLEASDIKTIRANIKDYLRFGVPGEWSTDLAEGMAFKEVQHVLDRAQQPKKREYEKRRVEGVASRRWLSSLRPTPGKKRR